MPTMKTIAPQYIGTFLGLALRTPRSSYAFTPSYTTRMASSSSSSALDMVRNRGLERREEGATPLREYYFLEDVIIYDGGLPLVESTRMSHHFMIVARYGFLYELCFLSHTSSLFSGKQYYNLTHIIKPYNYNNVPASKYTNNISNKNLSNEINQLEGCLYTSNQQPMVPP